jgi:AraC-like DNA-binding protein
MREPTMSMRLVRPFVEVVKQHGLDARILKFIEYSDPDARISAKTAIDLLRLAVRLTQNETLGLEAALATGPGDYGDMEYATGSCDTVGDAMAFIDRYYFVLDDASKISHFREHGRVYVEFAQPDKLSCRASIDFTLSMLYLSYVRWVGGEPTDYEVRFPYSKPEQFEPYTRVFGSRTRLQFDAPASSVVFAEGDLGRPLRYSDPKLHALLARHLHDRYKIQPLEPSLVDAACTLILEELSNGKATIDRVAARLGMSRRSLSRKLEEQGTSFRRLLCDVRCACAVRLLLLESYSVNEISERLGYSEPAAFHRAFRSWFGATPMAYRQQQSRTSL